MKWPSGITSSGVTAGIKDDGGLDLGVIAAVRALPWAGTFTRNAAAAACVHWSKAKNGRPARAIVVNSGNANACTGEQGVQAVEATAEAAAREIGCGREEILVASTGPIGIQLPVDKLTAALPAAVDSLGEDMSPFSEAILTTDSKPKVASFDIGRATIVGVCKGAAMIAPNMATMLAFLATDAAVESDPLQTALSAAVAKSFDCLCIDACESTNDSVFVLASGTAGPVEDEELRNGLEHVCKDLAEQIARDAEGASRVLRIRISGAQDDSRARDLGRAIASSALWRAAVFGSDPNWGRILAAMGGVDRTLDAGAVELSVGGEVVFWRGEPKGSLSAAAAGMAGDVVVECAVGAGPGSSEILSADLSPDYVTLNAYGTT